MMKFLLTLLSIAVMAAGVAADPVKLPPKEKFLLVLLAGQSNMAGRGFVQDSDKIPSPRVVMLDKAYKVAAEEMGVSVNSLKTYLSRGLRKLRARHNLLFFF